MVRKKRRIYKRVETEYNRMGVDPAEAGKSLLHDDHGLPKVPRKPEEKMPPPEPVSNKPHPVKAVTEAEQEVQVGRRRHLPSQPFAHVGVHQEKVWFEDENSVANIPVADTEGDLGEEYDEIDIESLQGSNPLDQDEQMFVEHPTEDELLREEEDFTRFKHGREIEQLESMAEDEEPEEQPKERARFDKERIEKAFERGFQKALEEERKRAEDSAEEDVDEIDLDSVQPLEYVVILDDEIIATNRDRVFVKNMIGDMLIKHEIEMDRIKVFRRIPVDFGVVIGE